jgi:hypothetical protein
VAPRLLPPRRVLLRRRRYLFTPNLLLEARTYSQRKGTYIHVTKLPWNTKIKSTLVFDNPK